MTINEQAPVVSRAATTIAAPADRVWALLAAVNDWPRWYPEVKRARLEGTATEGTTFQWKSGRSSIVSRLQVVDSPRELAWTGRSLGVTVMHRWTLTEKDGVTALATEESMQGGLARLLRRPVQKMLDRRLQSWLTALKAEAEAQTNA